MYANYDNFGVSTKSRKSLALISLILGLFSLIAWYVPPIGYPVSIIGVLLALKTFYSHGKLPKMGFVLSSLGLLLTSTLGFIVF